MLLKSYNTLYNTTEVFCQRKTLKSHPISIACRNNIVTARDWISLNRRQQFASFYRRAIFRKIREIQLPSSEKWEKVSASASGARHEYTSRNTRWENPDIPACSQRETIVFNPERILISRITKSFSSSLQILPRDAMPPSSLHRPIELTSRRESS